MSDLQNATIEIIEEVKTTKGKYGLTKKIKGKNIETGQTNTYTLYDKKADGTTSKAWTDYPGIGATAGIGFVTKEGNLEDGTPYTQRIIRNFDLDVGNGVKNRVAHTPAPAQNSRPGANSSVIEPIKQGTDEFSRRLGVQGHVNALLSNPEIFKIHKGSPTEATSDWIVKAAIEIEYEINKQLNPSKFRQAVSKFAPGVAFGEPGSGKQFEHPHRRLSRFCVSGDNQLLSLERRPDYATDQTRTARRAAERLPEAG